MANKRTPLAPVDAAWFHMDRPANEVVVTSMLITETPLMVAEVKALLTERLLPFERFRQRVVEHGFPVSTPHWELDPFFDLDTHVHHLAVPGGGSTADLLELVSDLSSMSLDYHRPLWQAYVVDRVGAGSALVLRFHHCLADGTAMMTLAGRLFDKTSDGVPLAVPPAPAKAAGSVFEQMLRPALSALERMTAPNPRPNGHAQPAPRRAPDDPLSQMQLAAEGVGAAIGSVIKPADPLTPLKGKLSGKQRIALSDPIPLAAVKAVGQRTGTKVNDVLIAAMTGALRTYLFQHHAKLEGLTIRAVVPVDLRPPGRGLELGNAFGLTFLDLPVSQGQPLERLRATKKGMDAIKRSPEAMIFLNILGIFGQTPKAVEDIAADVFGSKATLVMTNVMGPGQQLYFTGKPINRIAFWVPHPVSMGLGVSILSYNGAVTLGAIADAAVLPDPSEITSQFNAEFAQLCAVTGVTAAPPTAPAAESQCAGTTRSGTRCKHRPIPGAAYCRQHQPAVAEVVGS